MKKTCFFRRFICLLMIGAMLCCMSVNVFAAEKNELETETGNGNVTMADAWYINTWGDTRYFASGRVAIPKGTYTFYYSVTTPGHMLFNSGDGYTIASVEISGDGQCEVTLKKDVIEWVFSPINTSIVFSYSFVM